MGWGRGQAARVQVGEAWGLREGGAPVGGGGYVSSSSLGLGPTHAPYYCIHTPFSVRSDSSLKPTLRRSVNGELFGGGVGWGGVMGVSCQ